MGLVAIYGAACSSEDPKPRRGDSLGVHDQALTPPNGDPFLDFDENANANEIALTFDDGPDTDGNTASVLDALKSANVKATFFINTNNAVNVATSTAAQALVLRMQSEGHHIGNHTVHHDDLGSSSTDVLAEVDGVYQELRTLVPGALQRRLFRAPFGNPYFGPESRLAVVSPIVAQYGVHIGWNIDSLDWDCGGASCVTNNVLKDVDGGKSGIVLMHSINPNTASALPNLISQLKTRGKKFIFVEDLVVRKYGKPSRDLIRCDSNSDCVSGESCGSDGHCAPTSGGDAGTDTAPTDTGADTRVNDTSVADTIVADTTVTDTSTDTAKADTSPADTGSDTSVTDSAADTATTDTGMDASGTTTTLLCQSLTVESGSVANASTACSGTNPALSKADGVEIFWNEPSGGVRTKAYATYAVGTGPITSMQLTVRYRGDDKTEPLWYWWIQRPGTTTWDLVGDNSWAGNWAWTNHTFTISSPVSYVDSTGKIRVRFGSTLSNNSAELDRMVVTVVR